MRTAFHFSGDCTLVEVSVDISGFTPASLPFCSIPFFTEPTMVPREPQVIFPPVVPPHICDCITFAGTGRPGRIYKNAVRPVISMHVTQGEDCCDQHISLMAQINVPCFPLTVECSSTAHFEDTLFPHVSLHLQRIATSITLSTGTNGSGTVIDDQCRLGLSFDLAIPRLSFNFSCMAFGVTKSQTQHGGSRFSYAVDIHQTRTVTVDISGKTHWVDCRISFNFDFQYPSDLSCMAFGITKSQTQHVGPGFSYDVQIKQVRSGSACYISFNFDFQYLPPGNLQINYDTTGCVTMDAAIVCASHGTCRLSWHISVGLHITFSRMPSGHIVQQGGFTERCTIFSYGHGTLYTVCDPCDLVFKLSMSVKMRAQNWLHANYDGNDYWVVQHDKKNEYGAASTMLSFREIHHLSFSPQCTIYLSYHKIVVEFDASYGHERTWTRLTINSHTVLGMLPCQLSGLHVSPHISGPIKMFTIRKTPGQCCDYSIHLDISVGAGNPKFTCDMLQGGSHVQINKQVDGTCQIDISWQVLPPRFSCGQLVAGRDITIWVDAWSRCVIESEWTCGKFIAGRHMSIHSTRILGLDGYHSYCAFDATFTRFSCGDAQACFTFGTFLTHYHSPPEPELVIAHKCSGLYNGVLTIPGILDLCTVGSGRLMYNLYFILLRFQCGHLVSRGISGSPYYYVTACPV